MQISQTASHCIYNTSDIPAWTSETTHHRY